jgi:hypothetical protein
VSSYSVRSCFDVCVKERERERERKRVGVDGWFSCSFGLLLLWPEEILGMTSVKARRSSISTISTAQKERPKAKGATVCDIEQ